MSPAAVLLPNPAIGVEPPARSGYNLGVTESSILEALREEVRRSAVREGHVDSPFDGLYYYRADAPVGPKRIDAPGIVVAVIVDRAKTIELAGGQTLRYEPGSYLFVTREVTYTSIIEEASPSRPYLSFALRLDPEVIAETLLAMEDELDEEDAGDDRDAWVERWDGALGEAFLRLLRSVDDPLERRIVAPLTVREIVFRLLRSEHAGPLRRAARADDPRIRAAMRFVRERPAEAVTVEALAKRVAMSPSHFAHRFREIVRMTPMRYVKNVRLREARLLMLRDGLRASEAALEVGYQSPSHFTRDFKLHFGATPAAYARELKARIEGRERRLRPPRPDAGAHASERSAGANARPRSSMAMAELDAELPAE